MMKKLYVLWNSETLFYGDDFDEDTLRSYGADEVDPQRSPHLYALAAEWDASNNNEMRVIEPASWFIEWNRKEIAAGNRDYSYIAEDILSAMGYNWDDTQEIAAQAANAQAAATQATFDTIEDRLMGRRCRR